jgi:hypothetical protein
MRLRRLVRRTANDATAADSELIRAERLVREGRLADAVAALADQARRNPDSPVAIRSVDLRRKAAIAYSAEAGPGRSPWPPLYPDPFPDVAGTLPEIEASMLTADVMGGAVAHHGCLLVRGILGPTQVARAVDAIDRAQAARHLLAESSRADAGDNPWYRPFDSHTMAPESVRNMVASQGGTWLADSPAGTAIVLGDLRAAGILTAITEHFGEHPFFSLQKSTLRRSLPINKLTAWHQDGSFLGPEIRTMNVWLALSTCGAEHPAPCLEVVPKRVDEILPTEGNLGQSSIAFDLVDAVAADTPVIRPEFRPGDGLIFDERFLHRTFLSPDMTEPRYAVECWFFAPSHSAESYVSFLA